MGGEQQTPFRPSCGRYFSNCCSAGDRCKVPKESSLGPSTFLGCRKAKEQNGRRWGIENVLTGKQQTSSCLVARCTCVRWKRYVHRTGTVLGSTTMLPAELALCAAGAGGHSSWPADEHCFGCRTAAAAEEYVSESPMGTAPAREH